MARWPNELFARAQLAIEERQLAIEERRELQRRSRALQADREQLRSLVFASMMFRSEMKAYRDNSE